MCMPIIVVVSSTSSRTTTTSSSKQQHRHNDNKLSQIKHVLLMKDCYIIYHPTSFKHITKQHLHILIISDITYISSDVTGQAWHRFEDTGVSLDQELALFSYFHRKYRCRLCEQGLHQSATRKCRLCHTKIHTLALVVLPTALQSQPR